ncbi:uncharacterized protein LOC131942203 isoform X2 [Physella acuta]|nr:uncharacterized protein LOC131942203 isoform X2 [Physella acuta]XP_059157920.1 uncharacterized protein LOC131942203 isoform X2 [Physella acuta]
MKTTWSLPCLLVNKNTLFILICLVKDTLSACTANSSQTFDVIEESNYDRTYASITEDGKRPLGFMKATWFYNQPDNPCVQITAAANKRVELMYETVPKAKLCVSFQGPKLCSDSGTGQQYQCFLAQTNVVRLEFSGDTGVESDIQFWYRLVIGPESATDPNDYWCDGRTKDEFPSSLKELPQDYPLNLAPTQAYNTGDSHTQPCCLLFISLYITLYHIVAGNFM